MRSSRARARLPERAQEGAGHVELGAASSSRFERELGVAGTRTGRENDPPWAAPQKLLHRRWQRCVRSGQGKSKAPRHSSSGLSSNMDAEVAPYSKFATAWRPNASRTTLAPHRRPSAINSVSALTNRPRAESSAQTSAPRSSAPVSQTFRDSRVLSISCARRDLNPHALRRWNLNPVRLPIPPLARAVAGHGDAQRRASTSARRTICQR